jgi:hypothetical protein
MQVKVDFEQDREKPTFTEASELKFKTEENPDAWART